MYRANNPNAPEYRNYGMQGDNFTHVTYRKNPGYFEKLGTSCCGIVTGLIVVLLAFPLLFLNEGRAVQTAQSLDEGLNAINRLSSSDPVFDSNDRKLVHLNGKLKTSQPLSDSPYGIHIYSVKLKRDCEMYQWVEHEHKREYNEGERTRIETTYSYTHEWSSSIVNSGAFSQPTTHRNPSSFPPPHIAHTHIQEDVRVSEFQISNVLVNKINNFKKLHPKELPDGSSLKIVGEYYYQSDDPQRPLVGDVRISFSYAGLSHPEQSHLQDTVSIVAKQSGHRLSGYRTKAGDVLEILYAGEKTAEEIFASEHSANTTLTWVLRFVGWLMMFLGFQITMNIVRQIVSFIPIIRDIVSLATTIIAFSLSSSLSLITIAIGWLTYRPLLAAAILFGAAIPIFLSRQKAAKEKKNEK